MLTCLQSGHSLSVHLSGLKGLQVSICKDSGLGHRTSVVVQEPGLAVIGLAEAVQVLEVPERSDGLVH